MVITADSDNEGPAIKALGSLFTVTQVFLLDGDFRPSSLAQRWRLDEGDDGDDDNQSSDPVPDSSYVMAPQDLELARQMNEMGLPLSFQSNKKNGPLKGKKTGKCSKPPEYCRNPRDETLYEVSGEEIASPAKFHDKTSSYLSCISVSGQNESSYCDGAMGLDMTQSVSGERDNSACCTGFSSGVSREITNDNIYQTVTDDAQDGVFLVSKDSVDLNTAPASDTGVLAGSHLMDTGVNYCGTEHDESLIETECLEVLPIACKITDCEAIYNDDGTATSHPQATESELLPASLEGIGFDRNDVSNDAIELGDWMAWWCTYYKRRYFYNTRTHTSTWDAPAGMEHLTFDWSSKSDDSETLKEAEVFGTQNNAKLHEETLIEENLEEKQVCLAEIGVAVGSLVSDITIHCEDQSLDHSDECLKRSSCNDGVSCSSISNTLDHVMSSNERCIQAAPAVNLTPLENMETDRSGLDAKSDPFETKKKKKAKRGQRQRKLYNEPEDLHFQEMPETYSAATNKYWCQRYSLFSKYDDGIKMDEEGWFSVTPEAIAQHQAKRCAGGVIIDGFTGVGGNAIQFAQPGVLSSRHVIGIDIDPLKIKYARNNAAIYGVDDQIDFIVGDFFLLAPKLKADTVFLSPPWGGPDYARATIYDMKTMLRPHDGYTLFNVAKKIAPRIVMFLPRNSDLNELADISLSSCPPWSLEVEKTYLNGRLKGITAYFSDTQQLDGAKLNTNHS